MIPSCLKFPRLSAARQLGQPKHSQSANYGKCKLNSRNVAGIILHASVCGRMNKLLEAQYASEREIAFCIKQISSSRCCTFFIDAGFTVAPKLKLHVLTLGKVWEEEGAFKRVSPTAPLQKARISRRAQLVLLAFGAHDFLRTLI